MTKIWKQIRSASRIIYYLYQLRLSPNTLNCFALESVEFTKTLDSVVVEVSLEHLAVG